MVERGLEPISRLNTEELEEGRQDATNN